MRYLLVKNGYYDEQFVLIDKFDHVSDAKSYAKEHFNINKSEWMQEEDQDNGEHYHTAYAEFEFKDGIAWDVYCIVCEHQL